MGTIVQLASEFLKLHGRNIADKLEEQCNALQWLENAL